jgi:hypothetical protein
VQSKTKTATVSYYFGTPEKKLHRLAALKQLVQRFDTTPNGLIMMIADGFLEVRPGIIPDDPVVLAQCRARKKA